MNRRGFLGCGALAGAGALTGGSPSQSVLVRLAYAFEQATHHRKPPRFLRSAELPRG